MRKIEQAMLNAVHNGESFQQGNTQVWFISARESGNPLGSRSEIYLHGNHIASYWHREALLEVNSRTLGEWPTPTTKSRLRALGATITTKKGKTYLDGAEI
jgi:hypothetical protein